MGSSRVSDFGVRWRFSGRIGDRTIRLLFFRKVGARTLDSFREFMGSGGVASDEESVKVRSGNFAMFRFFASGESGKRFEGSERVRSYRIGCR